MSSHTTDTAIRTRLSDVGFSAAMQEKTVSELSGGWRMRLAIARAMLQKTDILYVAQEGRIYLV